MNMNDKQKQIEEMVEIMCDDFGASFFAEKLYDAGYRKASEVIDEFVERLKQYEESVKIGNEWKAVVRDVDIERIAAEMRQEVEE